MQAKAGDTSDSQFARKRPGMRTKYALVPGVQSVGRLEVLHGAVVALQLQARRTPPVHEKPEARTQK